MMNDAGRDDAVNCGSTPNAPPCGVREAMRARLLPVRSKNEIERLRRLIRRRPESPRAARCAPRCWTITLPRILEGTDQDFQFPGGRACNPPPAPAPAFPPGHFTTQGQRSQGR